MKQLKTKIIEICKKFNLPLNTRSTSIKILNKSYTKMSNILKDDMLLYLIIILSAKCEEVHEFTCNLNKELLNKILSYESILYETLNFQFEYSSPYSLLYSILLKLQLETKFDNLNNLFDKGCDFIDKMLTHDWSDRVMVYASLDLPDEVVYNMINDEYVKECVKECRIDLVE